MTRTNGTVDKHKQLPGYKLAGLRHEVSSGLPYILSLASLAASAAVYRLGFPKEFHTYLVCVPYALYFMSRSNYFLLGRHKFYVDGVQRPVARGWSQTLLFFFAYPLLFWRLLLSPESDDAFLAPRWVRTLFLCGMGLSLLGTFLIHQFLYFTYWVSLLVRFVDCSAINIQLATGLLCFGQCWKHKPIVALCGLFATTSCVFLALETRLRWTKPPVNDGVRIGSERARVEWCRLYMTAAQGSLVCMLGPLLDGFTRVSVCSSLCLFVGLLIYGFGNQYKFELPWNNIDCWHFHDDFHLLICCTQVCCAIIALRPAV